MPAFQHPPGDLRHCRHVFRGRDPRDNAVELVPVGPLGPLLFALVLGVLGVAIEHGSGDLDVALGNAGAVAEPEQHRGGRHVDVHVGITDAEVGHRGIADAAVGQDSNHGEPHVAHLDGAADRVLGGEEAAPDAIADDRHRQSPLGLGPAEPVAPVQLEVEELEVVGIDPDELAGTVAALAGDVGVEDYLGADQVHLGDLRPDGLCILVGEAGRVPLDLLLGPLLHLTL